MRWKVVRVNKFYEVSTAGDVRSLLTGRVLSPKPRINGYVSVSLSYDGKKKRYYVHRLVADAFLGGCPKDMQVNHLNFQRADNCWTNLEVVTCAQNLAHSRAAGRLRCGVNSPRGEQHVLSKVNSRQVSEIRALVASGSVRKRVAKVYGISSTQVSNIVNGVSWRPR